MKKNMQLKTKLLVCGLMLTIAPLAVISAVVLNQNRQMVTVAEKESTKLAYDDLDHITQNVYAMCKAQQEMLQENVNHSLNVARDILRKTGEVSLGTETVTWSAVNQYTNVSTTVDLPKLIAGQGWLGKNTEMTVASPVVDEVQKLIGGTCTIFQRMNEAGDMLRVCTNVQKKDGARAIGTYIPKTQADGTANPVVSAVMKGETYRGRALVVDKWYITAYEPVFDRDKKVMGMLYVGVPQESATSLRQAIMAAKVGQTGYVYVLDSKGNYVISKDGKRDGECIWDTKDAGGTLFIQEICRKAVALKPGEIAEQRYPWQNQGDTVAREKVVRIMFFEPWDWVIGVGSYAEEFYGAKNRLGQIGATSKSILIAVMGISFVCSAGVWFLVARGLAGRINRIVTLLSEGSEQIGSASEQVSAASQSLAEGSTAQAASLEEASSSLEEMASMTKQNADSTQQAGVLSSDARKSAENGADAMSRMSHAIERIQKSSDETAKIIKVIDDIAFQTNLLALNAAVEAARAGEAGKGFAVVAEEVRNLAMRSAEAAKNTANMIEESVKNAKSGVDITNEVKKVLDEIVQQIGKTSDLVGEIAAASQEQSQGVDQINTAVSQIDKVTQQNAANAEETASASEQLKGQADSLQEVVGQLMVLVSGAKAKAVEYSAKDHSPSQSRDSQRRCAKQSSTMVPKAPNLHKSDEAFHQIAKEPAGKRETSAFHGRTKKQDIPLDNAGKEEGFTQFNE